MVRVQRLVALFRVFNSNFKLVMNLFGSWTPSPLNSGSSLGGVLGILGLVSSCTNVFNRSGCLELVGGGVTVVAGQACFHCRLDKFIGR